MASNATVGAGLTVDHAENTKELAETLTEFEVNSGVISAENEPKELAASDRFQQRLERFGKVAPEAKKISRALRFGTAHEAIDETAKKRRLERFGGGTAVVSEGEQEEKKRKRVERFHTDSSTPAIDDETKQKRIDRFGIVTPSSAKANKSSTPALTDTIKKRMERFGDVSDVAKANTLNEQKAKRAERFKPITSV
ncbi:unnamed protein product [Adineta ricciae]|uniref:THO1-MOS11 C-terminal domain-containing protein n=1 Tax=Adineta ricciae TaxID=249248 RepID=A0A814CCF4_ADIRI|nr:unnamed protein product [Adineta ricciae]CAF0942069.1 unnamed protein product [Adineta ricciae]